MLTVAILSVLSVILATVPKAAVDTGARTITVSSVDVSEYYMVMDYRRPDATGPYYVTIPNAGPYHPVIVRDASFMAFESRDDIMGGRHDPVMQDLREMWPHLERAFLMCDSVSREAAVAAYNSIFNRIESRIMHFYSRKLFPQAIYIRGKMGKVKGRTPTIILMLDMVRRAVAAAEDQKFIDFDHSARDERIVFDFIPDEIMTHIGFYCGLSALKLRSACRSLHSRLPMVEVVRLTDFSAGRTSKVTILDRIHPRTNSSKPVEMGL